MSAVVLAFYEVHFWPDLARIMVINKPAHLDHPVLTTLVVEDSYGGGGAAAATVAMAHMLGAAGQFDLPDARVVVHDRHGNILATPAGLGLPVTVLRRARP